jgi:hypothetical protein
MPHVLVTIPVPLDGDQAQCLTWLKSFPVGKDILAFETGAAPLHRLLHSPQPKGPNHADGLSAASHDAWLCERCQCGA